MDAVSDDSASSQTRPPSGNSPLERFVAERTAIIDLDDETSITVRPGTPADTPHMVEAFARLSPESVRARFLRPMPRLTERDIAHLSAVDQVDHFAWVAFDGNGEGVGVARYIRDSTRPNRAEAAVTVVDEYQKRGIGSILVQLLMDTAVGNGIEEFVAYVGNDNTPMTRGLEHAGAVAEEHDEYATTFVVRLPVDVEFDQSVLRAALRAVANPPQP